MSSVHSIPECPCGHQPADHYLELVACPRDSLHLELEEFGARCRSSHLRRACVRCQRHEPVIIDR